MTGFIIKLILVQILYVIVVAFILPIVFYIRKPNKTDLANEHEIRKIFNIVLVLSTIILLIYLITIVLTVKKFIALNPEIEPMKIMLIGAFFAVPLTVFYKDKEDSSRKYVRKVILFILWLLTTYYLGISYL